MISSASILQYCDFGVKNGCVHSKFYFFTNLTMAQKKTSMSSRKNDLKKSPTKKSVSLWEGKFYHIELHPSTKYKTYRNQDVGKKWGLERLAGKKESGERETASRLISKKNAHVSSGWNLIIDNKKDAAIKKHFHGPIRHLKGDIFRAHPATGAKAKKLQKKKSTPTKSSKKTPKKVLS